jgi:hypothetical protein
MATKRTYTRRTTRDRVVALLEEAIQLVKARCVEPEKGTKLPFTATQAEPPSVSNFSASVDAAMVGATPETQDLLAQSRLEFAKAAELKKQANALLQASNANSQFAKAAELKKQANALLEASSKVRSQMSLTTVNTTLKKKLPSCPGGPKAFNEYFKKMRPVVEGEMPDAKYSDVRAEIAKRWKESCSLGNKTRKASKTKATPGRVNAPLAQEAAPLSAVAEEEAEALDEAPLSQVAEAEPAEQGYTNLGMDDTLGMRKIEIEGRPLYMTDANSGVFERDDDSAGAFVGYIRNGKLVEQEQPDE